MKEGLEVRFWGTRGSCAAPFSDRMEFGGNTSCVSVRWEGGLAVLDGGTGIAALGAALDAEEKNGREIPVIHVLISHLHLDHVCGLPFFSAFYQKGREIHLYGRAGEEKSFREALCKVAGPPCWPLTPDAGAAEVVWHDLKPESTYNLAQDKDGIWKLCAASPEQKTRQGLGIRTMLADHPDQSLMYRLELDGSSIVYGLDCEFTERIRDAYEAFAADCDLLVFDGMYTDEEYQRFLGFGHGTWQQGALFGRQCGAGLVCISHHDWKRTDSQLGQMELQARQINERCRFAREGMKIKLGAGGAGRTMRAEMP